MILKVKEVRPDGFVLEGQNNVYISNKVRVSGTTGLKGYGMVRAITWQDDSKIVNICWAHSLYEPNIKIGDEIKFTRE